MLGALTHKGKTPKLMDPNAENLVARVSRTRKEQMGGSGPHIILVDCGMKENIRRSLLARGVRVTVVPWNYDFTNDEYDGIVISNGPGDPTMCKETIEHIRTAFKSGKPMLGICLGTQLMALAAGATTYKLSYGHRGHNQPCLDIVDGKRCYITSQNHGYAVRKKTLPSDWHVWFENVNDGSIEGIRHKTKPWSAVQFHPEASPGPTDTTWVFDEFVDSVRHKNRSKKKS
jgi:carbamoyl-phosphate synthase small subunit